MTQPDLAGFRAAQQRLADGFGAVATFRLPADPDDVTWPVGTGIDPETGMPYDPVVEAESGGDPTEVEATVQVVHRTSQDQTVLGALGWMESAEMALILMPDQYAEVEGATEVVFFNERQRIVSFRPDGIQADTVDRWICFTEGM